MGSRANHLRLHAEDKESYFSCEGHSASASGVREWPFYCFAPPLHAALLWPTGQPSSGVLQYVNFNPNWISRASNAPVILPKALPLERLLFGARKFV